MVFLYPVTFPAELAGSRSSLPAGRSMRSSPIGRAGNRFPGAGPRRRLLAVTGRGLVVLKGSPGGSPAHFSCISMQSLRGPNVLSCRWSRPDAQVVPRQQRGPFVQDVPLGVVRPSVHPLRHRPEPADRGHPHRGNTHPASSLRTHQRHHPADPDVARTPTPRKTTNLLLNRGFRPSQGT